MQNMKRSMRLSSVLSVHYAAEMSFSSGPQHLGTGGQKAMAKPLSFVSTQRCAGARGCKAVRVENNVCSSN